MTGETSSANCATKGCAMIVTIVTFDLAEPKSLAEMTPVFQSTASKYQGLPGLLRKNYFLSEDGRRAAC